jgi:hypothetical protein
LFTLKSAHFLLLLAGSLGYVLGGIEDNGAGGDGVAAGGPMGGGVGSCDNTYEPATERSPFPSSCGASAITGVSLNGSTGGWHCRLRFAGGAGGDGPVVAPPLLPADLAAGFLAAARIFCAAAAAAFAVVAAAALEAAAAGAAVAAEAETAA